MVIGFSYDCVCYCIVIVCLALNASFTTLIWHIQMKHFVLLSQSNCIVLLNLNPSITNPLLEIMHTNTITKLHLSSYLVCLCYFFFLTDNSILLLVLFPFLFFLLNMRAYHMILKVCHGNRLLVISLLASWQSLRQHLCSGMLLVHKFCQAPFKAVKLLWHCSSPAVFW